MDFLEQGATAVVMPKVHPPQFGMVRDGEQKAVLQGHNGAFHTLLLLLMYMHKHEGGNIGGVPLDGPRVQLGNLFE